MLPGMPHEPPLSLESYAEVSAAVDAGVPRDRAVREVGLTVDQWLLRKPLATNLEPG